MGFKLKAFNTCGMIFFSAFAGFGMFWWYFMSNMGLKYSLLACNLTSSCAAMVFSLIYFRPKI